MIDWLINNWITIEVYCFIIGCIFGVCILSFIAYIKIKDAIERKNNR